MNNVENRFVIPASVLVVLLATACPSLVEPEPEEINEIKVARYAINVKNTVNGTVNADHETAEDGETITLTVQPEPGYETASVSVTGGGDIALSGNGKFRKFTMPAEDVSIAASFTEISITNPVQPQYSILMAEMTGGSFDSVPADLQYEGSTVTLTAKPDTGKRYCPGSLEVKGVDSQEKIDVTQVEDADDEWSFVMPAEDVEVNAAFIVETIMMYGITIAQLDNGNMECGRANAGAGELITISLHIDDTDEYRYQKDSFSITGASGEAVNFEPAGDLRWAFTMPGEDVTVNAIIELIPWYSVTLAEAVVNGSINITGVNGSGPFEGKAREGTPISITATPDPGYRITDHGLFTIPADAVIFTKADGRPEWTFDMAAADLKIGIEFAQLSALDIFRGGAGRGITIGELSDDKKFFRDSVDMESEEPGLNGNQRTIKITHALNDKGGAAQQSFGLFSDTEISLDGITALSFWAKANKKLNIRYVGFGDDDPDQRVVYTGENYDQSISVGAEWKRYVVPVPAPRNGKNTKRVFFFNASIAIGNYVCIDEIEFIQSGVALTEITLIGADNELFYGAADAVKILKSAHLKLVYTCDDGTMVTLQDAGSSHTLKHNLTPWLIPFIGVGGNVNFSDGVITAREKGQSGAFSLSVNIPGARSNSITANIVDGLLLDDFEDIEGTGSISIPGTPSAEKKYLWHTSGGSPVVVGREYVTVEHKEIFSGLRSGSWRPPATSANKTRGGRNFEEKDADGYNTLTFRIKVTVGGGNTVPQKNTVFTFELKNGGTLTNKTSGEFFARQFTYDTDNADGWQEVTMPLAEFVKDEQVLDITAITGYAFGVVDNQGSALRIMLDDIALIH